MFALLARRYMSKQGTDLDLLRQFQIYEAVLHHEDGEEKGAPLKQLDETIRYSRRMRTILYGQIEAVLPLPPNFFCDQQSSMSL